MDLTPYINLVLAFGMVLYVVAAAANEHPWMASAGVLAGALNVSQFILHQQPTV